MTTIHGRPRTTLASHSAHPTGCGGMPRRHPRPLGDRPAALARQSCAAGQTAARARTAGADAEVGSGPEPAAIRSLKPSNSSCRQAASTPCVMLDEPYGRGRAERGTTARAHDQTGRSRGVCSLCPLEGVSSSVTRSRERSRTGTRPRAVSSIGWPAWRFSTRQRASRWRVGGGRATAVAGPIGTVV
jgi:hypothetical protein